MIVPKTKVFIPKNTTKDHVAFGGHSHKMEIMYQSHQVEELVKKSLPEAQVTAIDLTGTQDHWRIVVVDAQFKGMPLIKQHQMVLKTVQDYIGDGRPIHAVEIKTLSE
jgi:stress-induced morphogen